MGKIQIHTLLVGMVILLFSSCATKSFDTSEALLKYIQQPDQGYHHTKTVNGVDFSLLYKPTDLLVDQELTQKPDKSIVDSLRNKYSQYLYFNLSMSKNNQELLSNVAGNRQQFGAMVNQLAFGMEQKIHVFTPHKDTIPMVDYIYPRMYGMSGATSLLLVYPRKEISNQEYVHLTIEDLGFYTGEVKFKIPTTSINSEPKIKF